MPFSLITQANFFVVIIALIIVFFLLGFILGTLTNRPKKDSHRKKKAFADGEALQSDQTDSKGPTTPENPDDQDFEQNRLPVNYKTRYHNNYW